ncbi:MAG: class I SAM-dependent methyltransferase [Chloroflexota bacterium]|nr:class I SAM-dependent methyltransferase [Chloroflexota bacterium]
MAVDTATRDPGSHIVPTTSNPELEASLVEAIEPWLQHMKWRADFDTWRERRIWQEDHQEANLRDIRPVLGPRVEGTRLLDLGAGMGGLSVALLREFGGGGLEVQATDYNPSYAQIARLRAQRYSLDLPITVAAGEKLPYAESQFEMVLCMDVLEHVQDVEAVVSEIYRVLKPGGVVLTTVPNRRAFRDPHYHLPLINWLPAPISEQVIKRAGRSKSGGPLQDRQEHSELNTYTWTAFARLASSKGFRVRDQVRHRILTGEIRQLHGLRRTLLSVVRKLRLVDPLYRIYRYGWQGTYQVMLVKPR